MGGVSRSWLRIRGHKPHATTVGRGLADLDPCLGDDRLQHVRAEAIAPEVVKHAAHWKRCRFAVDEPIPGAALLVGSAVHLFDYPAILVDGPPARYLFRTGDVLQRALRPRRTGVRRSQQPRRQRQSSLSSSSSCRVLRPETERRGAPSDAEEIGRPLVGRIRCPYNSPPDRTRGLEASTVEWSRQRGSRTMKTNKALAAGVVVGLFLIAAVARAAGGRKNDHRRDQRSQSHDANRDPDTGQRPADCRAVRLQRGRPLQQLSWLGPVRADVRRNRHRGFDLDAHLHQLDPGGCGRMVPRGHREHGDQGDAGEAKVTALDPFRRIKQPMRVGILRRDARDFNFHGYVIVHLQHS